MTNDPNTLSQVSSCFRCLSDYQLVAARTSLLCSIASNGLLDPLVIAFSNRIVANGGAPLSSATEMALNGFIKGMKADGNWSKMLALNVFLPDSLTACLTPLIVGGGSNPWVNHGFTGANLSTAGLTQINGSNNYLDTGCNISTIFSSVTDCGFTWASNCTASMTMRANAFDGGNMAGLYADASNARTGLFQPWDAQPALISGSPSKLFCSASRAGATATVIQKNTLNGSNSTSGAAGAARPNLVLYAFCWNTNNVAGTFPAASDVTCSLVAIHTALSATDTDNFYARFQALRTALGGGSV